MVAEGMAETLGAVIRSHSASVLGASATEKQEILREEIRSLQGRLEDSMSEVRRLGFRISGLEHESSALGERESYWTEYVRDLELQLEYERERSAVISQVLATSVEPASPIYSGPCVYVLSGPHGTEYVGSSIRGVWGRFGDHCRKPWWPHVTEYRVIPCRDEPECRSVETSLIESLKGLNNFTSECPYL